jgi:hypothetical protein
VMTLATQQHVLCLLAAKKALAATKPVADVLAWYLQ